MNHPISSKTRNRFLINGQPADPARIAAGVTFSGNTLFDGNAPALGAEEQGSAIVGPTAWKEDHPLTLKGGGDAVIEPDPANPNATVVTMPLMGHEFRFSDRHVAKVQNGADGMDLAMHIDPLLAVGNARLRHLGRSRLDEVGEIPETGFLRSLWGVETGDLVAVRTNAGRTAVLEVLALTRKRIRFRYVLR